MQIVLGAILDEAHIAMQGFGAFRNAFVIILSSTPINGVPDASFCLDSPFKKAGRSTVSQTGRLLLGWRTTRSKRL